MENTYTPRYNLYPTNPQILHHLVLELFVRAPQYPIQEENFYSMMPSGPIYKYGWVLAEQRKQVFQSHPDYTELILIASADLPIDITGVVTTDEYMHSFFWTIQIATTHYVSWFSQSADMFTEYAKSIEAQLPFIRWYKHLDSVIPYIININQSQSTIDGILDMIISHHTSQACYVFIQPETGVEKIIDYVERR